MCVLEGRLCQAARCSESDGRAIAPQGCWLSAPAGEKPGGAAGKPPERLGLASVPQCREDGKPLGGWAEWFSARVGLGLVSSFG